MKTCFLAPLICLVSTSCLAGTMGEAQEAYSKVVTFSAGPAWTTNGKTQIIELEPDLVKAFVANDKNTTLASSEIFLGLQRNFNPGFAYQVGIAFAASSSAKLSGSVWDEADPDFDNFYYKYKVNHTHVAVKGKLIADTNFVVQPYISGSLGAGFNRSYDFLLTQKIVEQSLFPAFNSHTETSFTYTAGAGVQKAIDSHWTFGAGYEFADWGKSNLARTDSQPVGSGLKLSHLYTHQLQFSLSYYI